MTPLWIVSVFISLIALYTAFDVPRQTEFNTQITADVSATNFIAYRQAVQRYVQANPGASGTISDASLAPFWLTGYVRDANWTNSISGGAMYVYSTAAVPTTTLNLISNKSGDSALVGIKNTATGRLQSANGFDTGIVLPGWIPNNALVVMGN